MGEAARRGEAAVDGRRAVVLKVQKQPQASTLELTERVDRALDDLAGSLPEGMSLYRKGFRQADFIRVALDNVATVLRDGAILVAIVLTLFLMSWRTALISLLALPLSLLAGVLVLRATGASINTMTLGGFAIAIGELVDDAIIDRPCPSWASRPRVRSARSSRWPPSGGASCRSSMKARSISPPRPRLARRFRCRIASWRGSSARCWPTRR
jgi:hypothetical protein